MNPSLANIKTFRRKGRNRNQATPYLFLLPFAVLFSAFFLLPILYALEQSLFTQHRSGLGLATPTLRFSGLSNYFDVFRDPVFYQGVGRVVLYGVVQVPTMLGLALLLALLLDTVTVRFKNFIRVAAFAPYAVPSVVAALLWGFFYNPRFSPIVQAMQALGLGTPNLLGPDAIVFSLANVAVWQWTGYNTLIIYAGLQAIGPELYEAARMDGCTGVQLARFIKIPLVAPTLILTAIFSIIGTLQLFNEPLVLKQISNSISNVYTPNLYAYYTAFGNNNYNYAAALAVLLAFVTFVFSFGFLRLSSRAGDS